MANITKKDNERGHEQHLTPTSPSSLIDRFFDDNFFEPFGSLAPSLLRGRITNVNSVFPKVDVSETDEEIRVVANVPGIDPDKIDIDVGDDYLSISGKIEREEKEEPSAGKLYRYEREYGEFRREFSLPARVDKDGIVAKAKNGVLTITLPKSEDERKTKVKVEVEK
jgi:HSP20 family protein